MLNRCSMLSSALSCSASYPASFMPTISRTVMCSAASSVRFAVVGDVHGQWCPNRDAAALHALNADMTLFVGDIGNEKVTLVQQIADLDVRKAVILGNHDAWYTMTARKRSRSSSPSAHQSPHGTAAVAAATAAAEAIPATQQLDGSSEPSRVQQQLDALGACHVGYGHLQMPDRQVSIVGARPFSKGGRSFRTIRDFMSRLYNVGDMRESAAKVLDVVKTQVPADNALIVMGHNGPAGLGAERHNICGVDWVSEAGDHGDPDLQSVLQQLQEAGRPVALVVFGHMHHTLKGGALRQMVYVDANTGTVYLNAATVPRVINLPQRGPADAPGRSKHHFLVVDVQDGQVHSAADVWVKVTPSPAGSGANTGSSTGTAADIPTQAGLGAGAACVGSGTGNGGGMQQPQQLQLHRQQHVVQGQWLVQVLDVQEVLRTVHSEKTVKHYWDAHMGTWKQVTVADVSAASLKALN